MKVSFNLIYIVPNAFSNERICVGMLAGCEGVPFMGIAEKKLTFALSCLKPGIRTVIRKGFRLMEFDVNRIRRGEESMPLFDVPKGIRLLRELSGRKKGVIAYSETMEMEVQDFRKVYELFEKATGEQWSEYSASAIKESFRKRFKEFTTHSRFREFSRGFIMSPESFPLIYKNVRLDLFREGNSLTVFQGLDLSKSEATIHRNIVEFRFVVQSLSAYADSKGLGKGRYYLVSEPQKESSKRDLLKRIQSEHKQFELILLSEIRDKI